MSEYWKSSLEEIFGEYGISEGDKFDAIVKDVEQAASMENEACGDHFIPDPQTAEIAELKKELDIEKNKVHCQECNGRGSITDYGPSHYCTSTCSKCNGKGRYTL